MYVIEFFQVKQYSFLVYFEKILKMVFRMYKVMRMECFFCYYYIWKEFRVFFRYVSFVVVVRNNINMWRIEKQIFIFILYNRIFKKIFLLVVMLGECVIIFQSWLYKNN